MIPMFRVRASGTCRATVFSAPVEALGLPLEVAEGLVRLGHLVRVLASLDGGAEAIARVHQLGGELLAHALAAPLAGGLDDPADSQRDAAIAADLDRDLIGGATDAPRLDLDDRGRVAERRLEDLEAGALGLGLCAGERLAQDPVGKGLLAVAHELDAQPVTDPGRG